MRLENDHKSCAAGGLTIAESLQCPVPCNNALCRTDVLEFKEVAVSGLGVFAKTAIAIATTLETAVALPLSLDEKAATESMSLWEYYFVAPEEVHEQRVFGYLILGLTSICNHRDIPNAHISWRKCEGTMWTTLSTIRPVAVGHEICIRYKNIDEYVRRRLISPADAYSSQKDTICPSYATDR